MPLSIAYDNETKNTRKVIKTITKNNRTFTVYEKPKYKIRPDVYDVIENLSSSDEIILNLVLEDNVIGLLDKIKYETKELDSEMKNLSQDLKSRFRKVKEELPYDSKTNKRLFKEKDQEFMQEMRELEIKYNITRDKANEVSKRIDALRSKRVEKVINFLKSQYHDQQEDLISELIRTPNTIILHRSYLDNSLTISLEIM